MNYTWKMCTHGICPTTKLQNSFWDSAEAVWLPDLVVEPESGLDQIETAWVGWYQAFPIYKQLKQVTDVGGSLCRTAEKPTTFTFDILLNVKIRSAYFNTPIICLRARSELRMDIVVTKTMESWGDEKFVNCLRKARWVTLPTNLPQLLDEDRYEEQ